MRTITWGQNHHDPPSGVIGPEWFHLALLERGELFSQVRDSRPLVRSENAKRVRGDAPSATDDSVAGCVKGWKWSRAKLYMLREVM
jgi:hypothetical protein